MFWKSFMPCGFLTILHTLLYLQVHVEEARGQILAHNQANRLGIAFCALWSTDWWFCRWIIQFCHLQSQLGLVSRVSLKEKVLDHFWHTYARGKSILNLGIHIVFWVLSTWWAITPSSLRLAAETRYFSVYYRVHPAWLFLLRSPWILLAKTLQSVDWSF